MFSPRPKPDPVRPGQESVWDYPRPPRVERSADLVEVVFGGVLVASTTRSVRVLETSHPPTYYLPFDDAAMEHFSSGSAGGSFCEWKGMASYLTLTVGSSVASDVAWTYPSPTAGFELIQGCFALYPAQMDECRVNGEVVRPQAGGFYGGWITDRVAGPFKGEPGSRGW
jgi:uncharacterized protein (DUF427 family)